MMRSAFVSLIWAVISWRRKQPGGFQMKELAEATGDKGAVSRWFSNPERPNWTLNTFADIAAALDLEIEVTAIERNTGARFASHGMVFPGTHVMNEQESSRTETERQPRPAQSGIDPGTERGGVSIAA